MCISGLDAETKKVPKKDDSAGGSTLTPTNSVNFSNIDGECNVSCMYDEYILWVSILF